ncbi:hypothetical protein SAMN05216350_103142 [Polaromonas sp. YR568]|uniref:hypothetical protein n=1 Tax=Polaromonas sp. YR568 TaxID=1855301 RepID=UPI0008ED4C80|nr:hypothetical protein [Polaromonas sp. YR568]SFU61398.1 hypothetical protein SAMN05216350_103142 [Polaromonas sp. YR568]
MKTVWITALKEDQPRVAAVTAVLKRYGLQCKGHFWSDQPDKLAWRVALEALVEAKADAWLVLVDGDEIKKPSVRYGLSLMAAALRSARGGNFPILTLWNSVPPADAALPPLLAQAELLLESGATWPAKIVAKANVPARAAPAEFRLDILGNERLGQWFEIGPVAGAWSGVVFGVTGADVQINFQAVGPKGALPDKTSLEFAQEGMQIKVGGRDFTAWAVRNEVGADASYFARVKGSPEAILFMPYAEESDAPADIVWLT